MRSWPLAALLLVPVLGLSACGDKATKVNTATYTCAQFTKSLGTKGDDSAGAYINALRKQTKLGQSEKVERREFTLGIYFACRGKPGTTRPAATATRTAKQIRAGKFVLPGGAKSKKKSAK